MAGAAFLVGLAALLTSNSASAGYFYYTSADVPKAIPDNDAVGVFSELIVPDGFVIMDLEFIFDELLHESVSDLRVSLTSPRGTTVVLINSGPDGGILAGAGVIDNFIGTIFDDQATTNLRDAFLDNHFGSYNIDHASVGVGPLSSFNGENAMGRWILNVSDRARFDTGSLLGWSLGVTAVPEPSGVVLLGVGLASAGIIGLSRRRLRPNR